MKVAIQGGVASFHDIAAQDYFKESIETVKCATFRGVVESLNNGESDYGFLAIENAIAGSILPNYGLLQSYPNIHIVGEYKMRIRQNLMALPGQKIEDITKVMSHYMALLQCQEFFEGHPWMELKEYHDTADSAKYIAKNYLKGVGAIAGTLAAEVYGLELYAEEIETIKENYTRFLVLSKQKNTQPDTDKATISFELPHEVGSLVKVLQTVVDFEINLTKIQSVPIVGKPDQYTFYADVTWTNGDNMRRCFVKLNEILTSLTVLGEYKNWEIVL